MTTKFITSSFRRRLFALSISIDKFLSCESFDSSEIIALRKELFNSVLECDRGFECSRQF